MLFNSYEFIFLFLFPVVLFYIIVPNRLRVFYLIVVSFVFYAQWDMLHLLVLCSSILVNYVGAKYIGRGSLVGVIGFDILLLGYFKYSGFLHLSDGDIVLPLAISFFTFQQIAYVVDVYRKKIVVESFEKYLFFVMFFPQLIAGPIVHYSDMMTQVKNGVLERFDSEKFQLGVVLFSVGLFSKVVIADSLVRSSYLSWGDLFSYSFMIYFDFSGYANMAIGLALLFGVVLPINFDSPYRARNLVDFWRRWHITLSNFLKEYIYIPLGGNRYGRARELFALMATMVIGGIWHGAGWNFLLWGALHGVGLVVVHSWGFKMPKFIGIALTFIYVSFLWVLFYSSSVDDALHVYKGLLGFDGFGLDGVEMAWLGFAGAVAWLMPNVSHVKRLKPWYGYIAGVLMFVSLKFMAETPSMKFVYFNF